MKRLNQAISLVEHLGHFDGIVPSLACILMTGNNIASMVQNTVYLLKTSGKANSKTLNFKLFLGTSVLKNLCLWCELHYYYFIISLVLKNVLTAVYPERSLTFKTSCIIITVPVHLRLRILITKLIVSPPFICVRQYCKCIADCCKGEQIVHLTVKIRTQEVQRKIILDCLICKMLFIKEKKPSLNTQSDSIQAKLFD